MKLLSDIPASEDAPREIDYMDLAGARYAVSEAIESLARLAGSEEATQTVLRHVKQPEPRKRATRFRKQPIPAELRWAVFERDCYRCLVCASKVNLSADHIIAESKGGPTTLENLQTLCKPCNSRKGAR